MPYDRQADAQVYAGVGRICLIEPPATGAPSGVASAALAGADVVLYDPALASVVARLLPAGCYAEPLTAGAQGGLPEISSRARQLAADGWSVVQLVAPGRQSRSGLPAASEADESPIVSAQPPGGRRAAAANAFTANGLAG